MNFVRVAHRDAKHGRAAPFFCGQDPQDQVNAREKPVRSAHDEDGGHIAAASGGRYASILNRLSGPSSGNSRSSASRSIATQPTVGEKVLRAMCRKIALPAPATVGKRL
jgi:hypothetical protein